MVLKNIASELHISISINWCTGIINNRAGNVSNVEMFLLRLESWTSQWCCLVRGFWNSLNNLIQLFEQCNFCFNNDCLSINHRLQGIPQLQGYTHLLEWPQACIILILFGRELLGFRHNLNCGLCGNICRKPQLYCWINLPLTTTKLKISLGEATDLFSLDLYFL